MSRRFGLAGLLVLVIVVAYAPVVRNGFVWDDDAHITSNVLLRDLDGLRRIWLEPGATVQYYPLTFTAWWFAYHLWGSAPAGYHLLNVLLHAAAAVLFWRLLARLGVPGAIAAAAVFALHPVHVMSVAWATELKNTLSLFLALASALAFLHAAGIGPKTGSPPRALARGPYVEALALFALAILAKTAVGLLPAMLLAILGWKRDRLSARDLAAVAPFALFALGLGRVTAHVEYLTGATGPEFGLSLAERVVVSGRSFWFYLGKLLWPAGLTFIYPRFVLAPLSIGSFVPSAAVVALFAALALLRRRVGAGPLVAALQFWLGTSALILFLVLYMTRYSFVSDHWQYLGSLGAIAAGGAAWTAGWERAGASFSSARRAAGAVILLLLGSLTWSRCLAYRDAETLWRDTLARNPGAWIAHVNLGSILAGRGAFDDALAQYVEALASDPFGSDDRVARGAALTRSGRIAEGLEAIRTAVADRPFGSEALDGIGVVLASGRRVGEALEFFEASVRANPRYASGQFNRGRALRLLGRSGEAIEALREALRLDPGRRDAHFELAASLHATGRDAEALAEVREFERLGGKPPAAFLRDLAPGSGRAGS